MTNKYKPTDLNPFSTERTREVKDMTTVIFPLQKNKLALLILAIKVTEGPKYCNDQTLGLFSDYFRVFSLDYTDSVGNIQGIMILAQLNITLL